MPGAISLICRQAWFYSDILSIVAAGNLFWVQIDMPRDNPSSCVVSSPQTPYIVLRGCD
jgi:hypothetical protein